MATKKCVVTLHQQCDLCGKERAVEQTDDPRKTYLASVDVKYGNLCELVNREICDDCMGQPLNIIIAAFRRENGRDG